MVDPRLSVEEVMPGKVFITSKVRWTLGVATLWLFFGSSCRPVVKESGNVNHSCQGKWGMHAK